MREALFLTMSPRAWFCEPVFSQVIQSNWPAGRSGQLPPSAFRSALSAYPAGVNTPMDTRTRISRVRSSSVDALTDDRSQIEITAYAAA
jgi:hypothetical protein